MILHTLTTAQYILRMVVLHLHVQIIIEEPRYDGHTEFSNEFFTLKCIKEKCKPHL